jgi:hypothetical protein
MYKNMGNIELFWASFMHKEITISIEGKEGSHNRSSRIEDILTLSSVNFTDFFIHIYTLSYIFAYF